MTKIVLRKTTSAMFLAIVLVLGTITLMHPSFIVGAQAESDDDNESDNNENKIIRTEDNDDDESSEDEEAKDDDESASDVESNSNANKLSENDDTYKIKELSYGSDGNSYTQSKDSSSSNVFVKKIKCNNINVNLNGLDVDLGLPFGNGPIAEAQAVDDEGTDSFESEISNIGDGQSGSNTNSRIVCINNNNNVIVEEEEPEPTPEEECEECFRQILDTTQFAAIEAALAEGIELSIGGGQTIEVNSFEEFCNTVEGQSAFGLAINLNILLIAAEITLDEGVGLELVLCIAEALGIDISGIIT